MPQLTPEQQKYYVTSYAYYCLYGDQTILHHCQQASKQALLQGLAQTYTRVYSTS
jgi:hypothetical protein